MRVSTTSVYTACFMRVPELDGLRGIAVMLVLITHLFRIDTQHNFVERLAFEITRLGWSGVDLFFVLSGFLITGILLKTKTSPDYFRTFYLRRLLRIFPLCYVSLLIFFFAFVPAMQARGEMLAYTPRESLWYFAYLSNWRQAFGTDVVPLVHFWSLAIEEQFYLVWPAVVFFTPVRRLPAVCLGLFVFSVMARNIAVSMDAPHSMRYMLTPFRMEGLALGSMLSLPELHDCVRRWAKPVLLASAAGLVSMFVIAHGGSIHKPLVIRTGPTLTAVFYAALLGFALLSGRGEDSFSRRILRLPLLTDFGKYSYALYVVHFPIMLVLAPQIVELWKHFPERTHILAPFACLFIGTVISYTIARISWVVIEEPLLRLKDRFEYSRPARQLGTAD